MSIRDLEVSQKPLEVQMLRARMIEIQQKMIDGTPGIVEAMIDIHKNLLQHEELVLLMDDDDIKLLHQAHEKHKQFAMIQKEVKKSKKKVDLSGLKASDL